MRIYEYAKLLDVTSKQVVEALAAGGFEIKKSHMAVLTDDELDCLRKIFEQTSNESKTPVIEETASHQKKIAPGTPSTKMHEQKELETAKMVLSASVQQESAFIIRPMQVTEAALGLKQQAASIILTLLRWGIVATKNQLVNEELVARLAEHYGVPAVRPAGKQQAATAGIVVDKGVFKERLPVVVVVGHVDHGKTTLLDYIRKTRVASREKGGITQHLGAYEAATEHGNLIFIDTPGHEAFSRMRARGLGLADIAILVVAADDSVKPQTVEAIKHIKALKVPVVVAVNKMDRVDPSRLETVRRDLASHDILAESWGGDVVVVPISAKTGAGIDQLLDMVVLQSQLLELKADVSGAAKGYVLESCIEKGRGPVATVLTQHGYIAVGDLFHCGTTTGKISSLIDSHGERVQRAGPSIPVRVAGFSELPEAGDYFEVVPKDSYRKSRDMQDGIKGAIPAAALINRDAINIIIKTDNKSSKEAVVDAIHKISKKLEKPLAIIHAAVGDVNESDVTLASSSGARIFVLHGKIAPAVALIARQQGIVVELFDIIYKLLERLEAFGDSFKERKIIRTKIGEAEVRKVFDIKGHGVIAGCYIKDGRFAKEGIVIGWRGKTKLGEGKIQSLQRDRKNVKEINAGFECAFLIDGIQDWAEGDRAECYIEQ